MILYVKRSELERLNERIAAVKALQRGNDSLRHSVDGLLEEQESIGQLVQEIKERGNQFSDDVEIVGNQVLKHGLKTDRLRDKLKEEKKEIKENVTIEKKVVKVARQMPKLERITRYVDAAGKVIGVIVP